MRSLSLSLYIYIYIYAIYVLMNKEYYMLHTILKWSQAPETPLQGAAGFFLRNCSR